MRITLEHSGIYQHDSLHGSLYPTDRYPIAPLAGDHNDFIFKQKTHIGDRPLHPETQMLNYGYDPRL